MVFVAMLVAVPFNTTSAAFAETTPSTISVGKSPVAVAVGPHSKNVYVANQDGNTVSVIDAASHQVTSTVQVGQKPTGVAVGSHWKTVYVTNGLDSTVSVIDVPSRQVTSTIPVGKGPTAELWAAECICEQWTKNEPTRGRAVEALAAHHHAKVHAIRLAFRSGINPRDDSGAATR